MMKASWRQERSLILARRHGQVKWQAMAIVLLCSLASEAVFADMVAIRLRTTDQDGNPISKVRVGDRYELRSIVQDTRGLSAQGVFGAYLDVMIDEPALTSVVVGETQTLTLSPNYGGGTFTLTYDGATTTPIGLGSNLRQAVTNLQGALESLPNIGAGNVAVTSTPELDPDSPWNMINPFIFPIRFTSELADQDVPAMGVDGSGLTSSDGNPVTADVVETHPADSSDPESFRSSFVFGPEFPNKRSAINEPGVFSEVGAFDGFTPLGGAEYLLFRVTLNADRMGRVTFTGDPADDGANEVLVFGLDTPVPTSEVDYGTVSIDIVPEPATIALVAIASVGALAWKRRSPFVGRRT